MSLEKDVLVTVENGGLMTLGELDACNDPRNHNFVSTTGSIQATKIESVRISAVKVYTEFGHTLIGSSAQRLLILANNGIARWVTLQNARPGDRCFTLIGQRVTSGKRNLRVGERSWEKPDQAAFLGALTTTEERSGRHCFYTAIAGQRKLLRDWGEQTLGKDKTIFKGNRQWTRFTGLYRLSEELNDLIEAVNNTEFLRQVRTVQTTLQKSWVAGIFIMKGQWTQDDLEVELVSFEVAKTLQAICENFGVRTVLFTTLNTFGYPRFKVALKSYLDQQVIVREMLHDYKKPITWKNRYVREEDENHVNAVRTLKLAKDILKKYDQPYQDIEEEDLDSDNAKEVGERVKPYVRSKTEVRVSETLSLLGRVDSSFDRVIGTEKVGEGMGIDVEIPIGGHYTANSIISC